MELNDLLLGVQQGLSQGLDTYNAARDRQRRDRDSQAGLLQKGMLVGPGGDVQYTPETEAQHVYSKNTFNPATPESQRSRKLAKGLLRVANPTINPDEVISDDMSAHEIENNPFINKTIQGSYGMQGRQVSNDRLNQSLDLKKQQFQERQGQNASAAGQAFEHDPIITQGKKTSESLNRAIGLMDGKTPLTAKSFNIVQQDLINALAPGGAATEGKVNRELVETAAAKLNELKLKFGNVSDLRKDQPELVQNLRDLIGQVHDDYADAMARQATDLHSSFSGSANPRVKSVVDEKLKRYSSEGTKGVGSRGMLASPAAATSPLEDQEALSWARANPKDPRAQQILQLHGGR